MIYELRQYECLPGKLAIVVERFRREVVPLWKEMEIRCLGFWTTAIGPSDQTLHYILVWRSLADRDARWQTFVEDPRWQAAKAHTELAGPLVGRISNTLMRSASVMEIAQPAWHSSCETPADR
ncbi:NIPSNAP protein [Hyphomicrobiales bacterium]|nr:NIPSNAP protein [Hyphomicrobiales bacterium]CAH1666570.1 NIPSNAP protein [Hyphomicrobiales bacterium]